MINYFYIQLQMIRTYFDYGDEKMNELYVTIEKDLMKYIYTSRLSSLLFESHDWLDNSLFREDVDELAENAYRHKEHDIDKLCKHVHKLCSMLAESNQSDRIKELNDTLSKRLAEYNILSDDNVILWSVFNEFK